jgi:Uma2 family endonuclease
MGVVSIDQAWPAAGQPFTIAELDRMPDDGRRYELLDGVLVVSPRPTTVHQVAAYRVAAALGAACPAEWQVVPERSPGTAFFDLNAKKAAYQGFGVESYWIVLPDLGKPELIAFELRRGQYEQVAQVSGDEVFAAVRPFPVEVVLSRLVAGLR